MSNEIKSTSYELSCEVKPEQKPSLYQLANVYRVFFARVFDIVISAIPGFVLVAVLKDRVVGNWIGATINLSVGLGMMVLYFVILPTAFHGNTFGKLIFKIRLKHKGENQTVRFYMLLVREAFFMLIPWVVALIFFIVALVIITVHSPDNRDQEGSANSGAYLIYQLGYLFYFLWFFFLCLTIKVQPLHQSGLDIKFNLYVVNKEPLNQVHQEYKNTTLKRDDAHIALSELPANFDMKTLAELTSSPQKEHEKIISLSDLDRLDSVQTPHLKQKKSVKLIYNDKENEKEWGK
ncbi:RDD family protein [Mesoplasma whartonense]|uniref:RDD family protein n=1 Tax=Mesoplasma whartonense TaxID=2878854 RepID=UPI002022B36D|nr:MULTISPECIES: RDD family protein [unclassified Mesoplasma]MCL8212689.1 hypothetical protein [Mesoplasma sp. JKS002661]MCL8213697.1 hypothetical protein [Mesoplasma sp. JKS002660]MCL8216402.1 hypothetical protein [Mesoplasma sp. JKS002657]